MLVTSQVVGTKLVSFCLTTVNAFNAYIVSFLTLTVGLAVYRDFNFFLAILSHICSYKHLNLMFTSLSKGNELFSGLMKFGKPEDIAGQSSGCLYLQNQ